MPESILAIHNGKSSRAFSLTPQDLLEDRSLSSDAKVVISWMIGKPKGWVFRIGHLRESLGIKSDSVWRRIRKELTEKGFLSIRKYVKNGEIAWDVRVNLVDYDMRRDDGNKANRVVPAVPAPAPAVAAAVEVEAVSEIVEAPAVVAVETISSESAESITIVDAPVSAAPVPAVEIEEIESEIPAPVASRKRSWAPELPAEIANSIKSSQQFLAAKLFESLCEQKQDGSIGEKLDERGRAYAAQIVSEADSPIALLKHLSKVGVRVGRLPELALPGESIVQAKARLAHREPKQSTYRFDSAQDQKPAKKKMDLVDFIASVDREREKPAPAPAAPAPVDGAALIKEHANEYMRWLKSASIATHRMIEDAGGVHAALEKFGAKALLANDFAEAHVALAQTPPPQPRPASSGLKGLRNLLSVNRQ